MSNFFEEAYKPVFSPVIRITKNKEKPTFVSEINSHTSQNIFDKAMEVKRFMENGDLPVMKAAKFFCCDGKDIANKLRLLEFSQEERLLLINNQYSEKEALTFLQLDKKDRIKAIEFCCNENLRDNCAEEYVTSIVEKSHGEKKKLFEVKDVGFLENSLRKTVDLAEKMGFEISFNKTEEKEHHCFTVKVRKKK